MEIGRQAHDILDRLESERHFDPNDIGSANKRRMRKTEKEYKKRKNEEDVRRRYILKNLPEQEHLPSIRRHRKQVLEGEYRDDVAYSLREDQGLSNEDISVAAGRVLRISTALPRRYGKRKNFILRVVDELERSRQFEVKMTRSLVEKSLRLFHASEPPQPRTAVLPVQHGEWSEPTILDDNVDEDAKASTGVGLAARE